MEVANKETYFNSIYSAVVVNADASLDPKGQGGVQIYIPQIHYRHSSTYMEYMKSSEKTNHYLFNTFPWAVSLAKDLKEGDCVYGSYINNKVDNYIILGVSSSGANVNSINSGESNVLIDAGSVLDMAMPIIIHNETGLNIKDWPDNISSSSYTDINPYDNGGWSIGLLQWHHARAYDCCYYIAKNNPDWESDFTDKTLDLYTDLKRSITRGNTASERSKYGSSMHPTPGSSQYVSIQNLLGSVAGKELQRQNASADTASAINILQLDPYNINNPAVLIYLADIMNQYGDGISSKSKAAEICKDSTKSTMEQFEEFVSYWKVASNNDYKNRRDTTYSYIIELDRQGKFAAGNLCDLGGAAATSKYIPEIGQYLWPVPDSYKINCYFGDTAIQNQMVVKYKDIYFWNGILHTSSEHSGIDIAPSNWPNAGDTIVACGNGTVTKIYNNPAVSYGYGLMIQMDKNKSHSFVYGHFCKPVTLSVGDHVKIGQVIGYMGTSGNSTGVHLHFELRINGVYSTTDLASDPLQYLGRRANL